MKQVLILLLFLFYSCKGDVGGVLLVVGDIGTTSARILYEFLEQEHVDFTYTITNLLHNQSSNFPARQSKLAPHILLLENLHTSTQYRVTFNINNTEQNKELNFVEFTTFDEDQSELNINVVSCNRYIEDRDEGMWEIVTKKQSEKRQQATVHLGDQIYGDNIPYEFLDAVQQQISSQECVKYKRLVEWYRKYYRTTWMNPSMRSTLRLGGNWMIPDDHELLNNANPDFWNAKLLPKRVTITSVFLKYLMRAGLQAFLEYQFQLHSDLPSDFAFAEDVCIRFNDIDTFSSEDNALWQKYDEFLFSEPFYFFRKIGRNYLLFADTRYQKNFHFDSNHQWVGKNQFEEIEAFIKSAESEKQLNKLLIFSAIPVFYCSEFASNVAYAVEGEKYSTHPDLQADLTILLSLLFDSAISSSKIVLFSGDLHLYFDSDICDYKSGKCIKQLCTSGISASSTALHSIPIYWFYILSIKLETPTFITPEKYYYVRFNEIFLWNNFISFSTQTESKNFTYSPSFRPLNGFGDFFLMQFFTFLWPFVFSLILATITFLLL